jgi:threonine/homoserine/homoserine lactone efflux protein
VTDAIVAGLLAGYGIALPVGAIAVLIMGLAARQGFRVGAAAGLGTATADGVYAALAVLGGAALGRFIGPVATPLRVLAAVVLVLLAVRIAVTALRHARDPATLPPPSTATGTPARAFATVLGLTLLNPATVVYFAALVVGRQAGAVDPAGSLGSASSAGSAGSAGASWMFVVAAFLASASWQLTLAGGGTLIGRVLTGPRGRLVTGLASSVVIATLAVLLVLDR